MQIPLLEIQELLKQREVEYKINISFAELSFLKLGGISAVVAYPKSQSELVYILRKAAELNLRVKLVGRMSNILPPDGYFTGLIIKTDKMNSVLFYEYAVCAECGITLAALSKRLAEVGWSGFEELSGIPGSVGGAVYMNAGAYGKEISDIIKSVKIFDSEKDEIRELGYDELEFSYRSSIFRKRKFFVLSGTFSLTAERREKIYTKMADIAEKRRKTQPLNFPSLGSVFKRQNGISAAFLIDRGGLKGARMGGAQISDKHAGFIVNNSGATSSDYMMLVEFIKKEIYRKFNVRLQEEIEYLLP